MSQSGKIVDERALTDSGETFLSDVLQDYHDGGDDYFIPNICDDWGLEKIYGGNMKIPVEYEEYGTLAEIPLIFKSYFHPSPTEIRKHPRNAYPRFLNEVFGEVCVWKEAKRRGEPHTELFAPVFRFGENYGWSISAFAHPTQGRGGSDTKHVEERGRGLGWAPDDTEAGKFNGRWVAIDYGYWWRQDDEWITDVSERPIVNSEDISSDFNNPPIPDEMASFEPPEHPVSEPAETPKKRGLTSNAATYSNSNRDSGPNSQSKRSRVYQWLTSLIS